jgi:uncharacterized protein
MNSVHCSWTLPQKSRQIDVSTFSFEVVRTQAETGDALAQFELGWMFANGQGVLRDDAQALVWYSKAAEQKNPQAQIKVGSIYATGRGVAPDAVEARKWFCRGIEIYQQLADEGDPLAQLRLAWIYQSGIAVPRNYAMVVDWLRKAACQGSGQAQLELGSMFRGGYGVQEDLTEAYKWFSLAAENDVNDAAREQNSCKSFLSPEQITEAARQMDIFKAECTPYLMPFGFLERKFLPRQSA